MRILKDFLIGCLICFTLFWAYSAQAKVFNHEYEIHVPENSIVHVRYDDSIRVIQSDGNSPLWDFYSSCNDAPQGGFDCLFVAVPLTHPYNPGTSPRFIWDFHGNAVITQPTNGRHSRPWSSRIKVHFGDDDLFPVTLYVVDGDGNQSSFSDRVPVCTEYCHLLERN